MGLNLAPLGKKIEDIIGGAAQGLGNIANATGQAVGGGVLNALHINPANQPPAPTGPQPGNPIIGTIQAIGQNIGNFEANNPYFNQGPLPVSRVQANAQFRDPNSPVYKTALALAGGAANGEEQVGSDAAKAAESAIPKPSEPSVTPQPSITSQNSSLANPAPPRFSSVDDILKDANTSKTGKQGTQLNPQEMQQVADLFRGNGDPLAGQPVKAYGNTSYAKDGDLVLGSAKPEGMSKHYVVAELNKNGQMTGRIRVHSTPMGAKDADAYQQAALTYEGATLRVPKTVSPKPRVSLKQDPVANALGMTPGDLAAAKSGTAANFYKPNEAAAVKGVQTSHDEPIPGNPAVKTAIQRAQTAENNPMKITLPEVKPGDHAQAIANSQQVSRPVDTARSLWESSMRTLKDKSPSEYKNFWSAVENPTDTSHSAALQEAISRWRAGADRAHAGATALGTGTGYIQNYARHPWDLSGWAEAPSRGGEGNVFTKQPRTHQTIAEGEAAGLVQKGDPLAEGKSYFQAAKSQLRKDALIQGLTKADEGAASQPHTVDLGYGKTVQLSDAGRAATKGIDFLPPSTKPVVKALRGTNKFIKSSILSLGQFHTINIGGFRAAAALIGTGHPVAAAKGIYGMVRGAFGRAYADNVIGAALKDGTVEKAAQIGMPYGSSEYTDGLKLVGVGEHTVFGKQIPMMHNQVARSIIADLEKRGIPLDSSEARAAGKAGNNMMGFINDEAQNISPRMRRAMGDALLAGQFTPAKFGSLRDVARGGVAGRYARATVAGNVAAVTVVAAGIGFALQQKSDDIKDTLLRALVDPAAATNMQDKPKFPGDPTNTLKLRLPGTNTSDVAKLLGVTLVRGADGHLGINWAPGNIPTTVADYLRARLSPLGSSAVKVGTNTNFAGKPLYDPNASLGTKVQQAATTLGVGDLPIGLQGVAYTDAVKNHVPGDIKAVLDAGTPGTNPVLKSVGSSFGLTPATDQTVGKGEQTSQYFQALADAKKGLNRQEQDALDLYSGSKKNPVTGSYDVQPTVDDQRAKATTLLQNPKTVDNLIAMNQKLAGQGQQIDPLWGASKDQITSYLQYQSMPPDSPEQKYWRTQNPWYQPIQQARSQFFDSLPPGDPNKPKTPIEFPQPSPEIQQLSTDFFNLPDAKSKAQFIAANPSLQDQFNKQTVYYNQLRVAEGYAANKTYPQITPQIQANLNAKRYSDPATQNYLNQVAEYNVIEGGANAQFQGTELSQPALKGIKSLGQYGMVQNPDGTLAIAGSPQAVAGAASANKAAGGGSSKRRRVYRPFTPDRVGGKAKIARIKAPSSGPRLAKVTTRPRIKAKVTFKPETV